MMNGNHGKGTVSAVVSFPPCFARTFSSRERRLGTRQSLYKRHVADKDLSISERSTK